MKQIAVAGSAYALVPETDIEKAVVVAAITAHCQEYRVGPDASCAFSVGRGSAAHFIDGEGWLKTSLRVSGAGRRATGRVVPQGDGSGDALPARLRLIVEKRPDGYVPAVQWELAESAVTASYQPEAWSGVIGTPAPALEPHLAPKVA